MNSIKFLALVACIVMVGSLAEAHKKFYGQSQPIYEGGHDRCVCDCARPQPVLPNKPYYGHGGYAQPRPSGGGYGNAGSYAVAGSYGSGGSQDEQPGAGDSGNKIFVLDNGLDSELGYPKDLQNLIDVDRLVDQRQRQQQQQQQQQQRQRQQYLSEPSVTLKGTDLRRPNGDLLAIE